MQRQQISCTNGACRGACRCDDCLLLHDLPNFEGKIQSRVGGGGPTWRLAASAQPDSKAVQHYVQAQAQVRLVRPGRSVLQAAWLHAGRFACVTVCWQRVPRPHREVSAREGVLHTLDGPLVLAVDAPGLWAQLGMCSVHTNVQVTQVSQCVFDHPGIDIHSNPFHGVDASCYTCMRGG